LQEAEKALLDETRKLASFQARSKGYFDSDRLRLQMRDALARGYNGAWSQSRTYERVRPI
jgi:hypothetical protein